MAEAKLRSVTSAAAGAKNAAAEACMQGLNVDELM